MTEIKGAGITQKEGMTVDGRFHIDDEEVRASLTYTHDPASDRFIRRLRWKFGLIGLVIPFGSIKNMHSGSPAASPAFFPAIGCLSKTSMATAALKRGSQTGLHSSRRLPSPA